MSANSNKILKSLKDIETRLSVVDTMLSDRKQAKKKKVKSKTSETPSEEEVPGNITYIVPHIARAFKDIEGKSIPVPQLVTMFDGWSQSLFVAACENRNSLGNKVLEEHTTKALQICQSLLSALHNHVSSSSSPG